MGKTEIQLLKSTDFNTVVDGDKVARYTLKNAAGMVAEFTNLGARLLSLWVPDRKDGFEDVILGPEDIKGAMDPALQYFGTIIGRCANRIRNAQFTLDGKEYRLATNIGDNHLHGGQKGFDSVVWKVTQENESNLQMEYLSPDGEEGYPGALQVRLVFELTEDNTLKIESFATTDQPTIVNLTHHAYFNLKGAGKGTVDDHELQFNASHYTPMEKDCIPSGVLEAVEGTPFDFRQMTKIGERVGDNHEQLVIGNGYDHNFAIDGAEGELRHAATVREASSGRVMQLFTNEPGVQLYTANHLDGSQLGKNGHRYDKRSGFCLETQHFPNSINQPNFSSVRLDPGREYHSICCYKFEVDQ